MAIHVIGDLMLDEWISGDVNRISPEAPVPVVNQNKVVKGRETGQWKLYEQRLSNPILMGGAIKPNSRFNWRLKEFEWAPMPGKYPGVRTRIWEGKSIHKLKPSL